MARYDLSETEWRLIAPLLPNKPRGVGRVDDRRVLNGIFYVLRTGSPWRDLPERYGPLTRRSTTATTAGPGGRVAARVRGVDGQVAPVAPPDRLLDRAGASARGWR
jgi:transposase